MSFIIRNSKSNNKIDPPVVYEKYENILALTNVGNILSSNFVNITPYTTNIISGSPEPLDKISTLSFSTAKDYYKRLLFKIIYKCMY
jgi:hypothetical protein